LSQRTRLHAFADRLHRRGVPVGQIDPEQLVGAAGGVEHLRDFTAVAAKRRATGVQKWFDINNIMRRQGMRCIEHIAPLA
jgi:hypothetical protein